MQAPILDAYPPGAEYFGTGTTLFLADMIGNRFPSILTNVNYIEEAGIAYAQPLGSGNYLTPILYFGTFGNFAAVADINGDGRPDILASNGAETFLLPGSTISETDTILTGPTSAYYSQPVTLTATVVPPTATGKVTFLNVNTPIAQAEIQDGKASVTISNLPLDGAEIFAAFGGSSMLTASESSALLIAIGIAPTSTTLHSLSNPSQVGQPVTFVAEVAPPLATGSVTFFAGAMDLGTVSLTNGRATLTATALTQGIHAISVDYYGDTDFGPSVSRTINQVVQ